MNRPQEIQKAYQALGKSGSFNDGMITCTTWPGKPINRIVCGCSPRDNEAWVRRALRGVPYGFSGKMLEVPVGTGILTMPLYKTLPQAEVTCVDCSMDMLDNARRMAQRVGLDNVRFQQGDAGCLPFGDESFDLVLSLNGFHAFPDKEAAYRETCRVLRKGGIFCGGFYVTGVRAGTDRWIRNAYERGGFLTPPFESLSSLTERLGVMYSHADVSSVKSIACFCCVK